MKLLLTLVLFSVSLCRRSAICRFAYVFCSVIVFVSPITESSDISVLLVLASESMFLLIFVSGIFSVDYGFDDI